MTKDIEQYTIWPKITKKDYLFTKCYNRNKLKHFFFNICSFLVCFLKTKTKQKTVVNKHFQKKVICVKKMLKTTQNAIKNMSMHGVHHSVRNLCILMHNFCNTWIAYTFDPIRSFRLKTDRLGFVTHPSGGLDRMTVGRTVWIPSNNP